MMHMPFQLTVGGAVIAMLTASNMIVPPASATLHLRKSMDVRPRRKTQTLQTVAASECDGDLAIVSFEYCFYSCGLDEAECQDLIEPSSASTPSSNNTVTTIINNATTMTTNSTTVVPNCTTNVTTNTAVAAEDSGDEGDPMACEPDPSGFDLVAAFLTVADATTYCSDNCGLDEEECTRWKQRYILAEMQRRRHQ
jgi:hypothetical protein